MKKCINILLAGLLFINSGGFIIIFYQLQKSAKQEMMSTILRGNFDIQDITVFRISEDQFKINSGGFVWKDKNEFEYKDCLYDIIKVKREGSTYIVSCINDITEAKIVKSFHNELNDFAQGNLNNSRIKTSLINLISQALIKKSFQLVNNSAQQKFYLTAIDNLIVSDKEIPTPPPKVTC